MLALYLFLLPPQPERASPLLFLLFSPILLIYHVTIQDFNIRLISFLLIGMICSFAGRENRSRFSINLIHRRPIFIWLTALLIFTTFACTLYLQHIYLSGDEPHYIMMSQSLVEDGDLDLKNNMEQQTYRRFHPLQLNAHGVTYRNTLRPFHMPGLSVLLLPFYLLYKLLFPIIPAHLYFRLAAAILNSLFALALFYLLKREFPGKNISGWWLVFVTLYPLAFHSLHLYPELPAAALLIGAYYLAACCGRKLWLSGLLLSLIPWFHLKYLPALMVLGLVLLFRWGRSRDYRAALQFLAFPLLSALVLILYSKLLYGTFNPANIFPSADYLAIPLITRLKTLLSYFLDQRDGLLLYAPVFLFLFFSGKSRLNHRRLLWGMALAYILFHAFSTLRGAYSPAGRPLVFISWIFMLFIIDYSYRRPEAGKQHSGLKLAAGMSYFVLFWLFYHPLFIYQPVFSHTTTRAADLLLFFGSEQLPLSQYFPSFISVSQGVSITSLVWVAMLLLLAILNSQKGRMKRPPIPPRAFTRGAFALLCLGLCVFPHITLDTQKRVTMNKINLFNNSRNIQIEPLHGMLKIRGGNTYHLYLDASRPLPDKLVFQLHSTPHRQLILRNGKKRIFSFAPGKRRRISLSTRTLKRVRIGSREVIHLGLECGKFSADSFINLQITGQ